MNPVRTQIEEQIKGLEQVRDNLGLVNVPNHKVQEIINDLQNLLTRMPDSAAPV